MAKIKHGIFGPVSGKLGPVIGGTWNNIAYLKLAPETSAGKAKRTPAQIANEQKMKFVNELLVPFHPFISVGFQNLAVRQTAISAAYSMNFHRAITGTYPDLGVDFSKMMISAGPLPVINKPQAKLSAPDTLMLSWERSEEKNAKFDDQLILAIYCPVLKIADGFIASVFRRDYQSTFKFTKEMIGQELEVYVGVASLNRKKIGNSVYVGRIG